MLFSCFSQENNGNQQFQKGGFISRLPKFRPNTIEPRNRSKKSKDSSGPTPPSTDTAFAKTEKSEVVIVAENVPEGSRFKGYQTFTIQEISITAKEITYKLEVWQALSGEICRGKLPKELQGQHFGPVLKAFITNLYAQGVTQPQG
jgi:hypothetical protein